MANTPSNARNLRQHSHWDCRTAQSGALRCRPKCQFDHDSDLLGDRAAHRDTGTGWRAPSRIRRTAYRQTCWRSDATIWQRLWACKSQADARILPRMARAANSPDTVWRICYSPVISMTYRQLSSTIRILAGRFALPWSAYVRLLSVKRPGSAILLRRLRRLRLGWSVRQLDRQIGSQFYERFALSKNKAAMLRSAETAEMVI